MPSCSATSTKFPPAQAELGRQWNTQNPSQCNPVPEQMGHLVRANVLQVPGEHASCGPRLEPSGFTYDPKAFMDAGVFFYNFGWKDYHEASMANILDMVKVLSFALSEGKVSKGSEFEGSREDIQGGPTGFRPETEIFISCLINVVVNLIRDLSNIIHNTPISGLNHVVPPCFDRAGLHSNCKPLPSLEPPFCLISSCSPGLHDNGASC